MPLSLSTPSYLDDAARVAVHRLAAAIEHRDGEPPLSDQALTHLGSAAVRHAVAHDGGRLVGYAQLDSTSLELAADAGGALLDAVLDALLDTLLGPAGDTSGDTSGDAAGSAPGVRVWSHGRHSPVGSVLAARGYRQVRVLHQLRRDLRDLPAVPAPAEGVTLRTFRPGRDEQAWLAVNAAAFAHHPEQGSWTLPDLAARQAEPWFDPDGFLLAERDGRLVGFHWTKIHDDGTGEVYVLGIHPDAQGLGLGAVLLGAGLAHLANRGCPEVLLYADDSNSTALHLYERVGFHRHDLDVQWAVTGPDAT